MRCARAPESPVSVASPVGADWPITRQKRPHTLIQEESFWQVEPGAAFAPQNIRQQNNSYLCGKVLNVFGIASVYNYPAEGNTPEVGNPEIHLDPGGDIASFKDNIRYD